MKVYKEEYKIPGADFFPENPYPGYRVLDKDRNFDYDKLNTPLDERDTFGYETGWRILPYRVQDRYNSSREIKNYESVVIENNILKVRILPQFGGMVADIFHKKLNKELIYRNPVIQPRNLALCDAWLSGGIEFNTGPYGHHCLTCRPVHTAVVKDNGEEFVRMFAWERARAYPYQIDIHLPDDSEFLYIYVKVINPHNEILPMYWWTNIGMEEYEGGRVIAPCDKTYETYPEGLRFVDCPIIDGIDKSYVTNMKSAYDLFFHIDPERRKWEVLVDKEGDGLLHVATDRLKSTKVFAWGTNPGSRHWSEYLSDDGAKPFQEIQFGVAPSQEHNEKMPPNATWDWTEAICAFSGDKTILHSDWKEAYEYGTDCVDKLLSREKLDEIHEKYKKSGDLNCGEILYYGLGWGELEKLICEKIGKDSHIPNSMGFSEKDLNKDQSNWLKLLNEGVFPEIDITDDPGEFIIGDEWEKLLRESVEKGKSNHWFAWFNLGLMARERLDVKTFESCMKKSVELKPNSYAYLALCSLCCDKKYKIIDNEKYLDLIFKAYDCVKSLRENQHNLVVPIVVSILGFYLKNKEYNKGVDFYNSLSDTVKNAERVRLQYGYLCLELDKLDEVEKVINSHFDNIAEGEMSVTGLWYKFYTKQVAIREGKDYSEELLNEIKNSIDPPHDLDFRMYIGDGEYKPPSER